ncbi:hypothetical protein FB45DRAFT_927906 [Roridomyces roridus]|uniref:Uncharacterized protein n=1 Tax=Roridomyces roridus TaxID=1738132 RepID=A0AAD7BJF1_9AGAR|nr:hypothetical protein FB45DRAFT_927906 [Roridomyces roridus]
MSRRSLFAVFFLLLWSADGSQVNVTIDDSDPSIVYSPSTSWNSSQVVCNSCNNPPVALAKQQTFHKGVHVRTAVYIFCIQPQSLTKAPAPPSQMNMTFFIDEADSSSFLHQGSVDASGFASGVNILAKQGLSDGPHSMKLTLAPNSVLILDFIVVTQNVPDSSTSSPSQSAVTSSASDSAHSALSPASDVEATKTGRASFGAVIGGVVGALGILSFGTAFSLYRRRLLAARRDRLERGEAPSPAFLSNANPGSVLIPHATPPTYTASTASSSSGHSAAHHAALALAASEPLLVSPSSGSERDLPDAEPHTYSDEVPPPEEEDVAPPSFGVAITTPAITLLSSDDAANPPPRPRSWGEAPAQAHGIPLPESNATSRGASLLTRETQREDEDEDYDDFIAQ